MAPAAALMITMAGLFLVAGCVDAKRLWWRAAAWRFKNPEANEPSEWGYGVARVSFIVGATAFVIVGLVFLRIGNEETRAHAELRRVVAVAATELSSTERESVDSTDVEHALGDARRVRVEYAGTDGDSDRYEITHEDGGDPVCMTVRISLKFDADTIDPSSGVEHSVSTSVDDGPC
jgi:hypothetical protein